VEVDPLERLPGALETPLVAVGLIGRVVTKGVARRG
jgi:hypothetical protein